MGISKRQTLLGIGTLTVGSGLILGSGAFSSIQADRTVSISTTGDASASIGLVGNDDDIASTEAVNGNSVLTIENSILNERSLTEFESAITVSNNTTTDLDLYIDPLTVEFQDNAGNTVTVLDFLSGGSSIVGESNSISITAGNSADLTIIIDLMNDGIDGATLDNIGNVSFVANEQTA